MKTVGRMPKYYSYSCGQSMPKMSSPKRQPQSSERSYTDVRDREGVATTSPTVTLKVTVSKRSNPLDKTYLVFTQPLIVSRTREFM